jgi:hypothetical protein
MAKQKKEGEPTVQKPMPSEMVIKEIMIQKGVGRDEAISILQNPSGEPEDENESDVTINDHNNGSNDPSINANSNVLAGVNTTAALNDAGIDNTGKAGTESTESTPPNVTDKTVAATAGKSKEENKKP